VDGEVSFRGCSAVFRAVVSYVREREEREMRVMPTRSLTARGKVLGGERPLVCVPLVGRTPEGVLEEARTVAAAAPDLLEVRADAWECAERTGEAMALLARLRESVEHLPLLFTCRSAAEGGFRSVGEDARTRLFHAAVEERLVDFVDLELSCGRERLAALKRRAAERGIFLVVSFHDFEGTPSREALLATVAAQVEAGADVAKVAVMPQRPEDVLTLLAATLEARRLFPETPLVTVSMGELGAASRVMGWLCGSDLTFAVGTAASAPGQIPLAALRGMNDVLLSPKDSA
jgi:3-dehydroquinate dehydratase-1